MVNRRSWQEDCILPDRLVDVSIVSNVSRLDIFEADEVTVTVTAFLYAQLSLYQLAFAVSGWRREEIARGIKITRIAPMIRSK